MHNVKLTTKHINQNINQTLPYLRVHLTITFHLHPFLDINFNQSAMLQNLDPKFILFPMKLYCQNCIKDIN